jgi:3-demethylubiquinone-9 3-methyltransferase
MSKITPHLWFDTQAKEAAEFYSEVFPRSQVTNVTTLRDTPSGDCDVVSFTVWDRDFMAISYSPSSISSFPPSASCAQTRSRARAASGTEPGSKLTKNEIDGLISNSGPAPGVPVQQALRLDRRPLRHLLAAHPLRCGGRSAADDRAVTDVHR